MVFEPLVKDFLLQFDGSHIFLKEHEEEERDFLN